MTFLSKTILFLFSFILLSLSACTEEAVVGDLDLNLGTDEEICQELGADWIEFSNGCVDSCISQEAEDIACAAAHTMGCDCGENQCWDSEQRTCRDTL